MTGQLRATVPKTKKLSFETQNTLREKYNNYFFQLINSKLGTKNGGNKLRTYCQMKNEYRIEPYLQLGLPKGLVKVISSFRLSCHRLEIEVGRHHRPNPIPAEGRLCRQRTCNNGEVEDENPFLFKHAIILIRKYYTPGISFPETQNGQKPTMENPW